MIRGLLLNIDLFFIINVRSRCGQVTQNDNSVLYVVYRVLQFPPEGWLRMGMGHCGITWLTIKPNGRVSLRSMGDTGHLPPDQLSS